MNRALIEAYAAGGEKVRRAVAGLTPEQLHARPGPGDWSVHEVVIHLADSDLVCIDRMKRVVCEDNPPLLNYDETAYMKKLFPAEQSLEDAVTQIDVGRRQWSRVLRKLPDEAFARKGTHNVRGEVTLGQMVEDYIRHVDDHLKFVHAKRERLTGQPAGGT
jgi:uncharacterized damage-inducible protein DinB